MYTTHHRFKTHPTYQNNYRIFACNKYFFKMLFYFYLNLEKIHFFLMQIIHICFKQRHDPKVIEWVIVVLRQHSNFSAIPWWKQVTFQWDDDKIRFVLHQHAELDFSNAVSLKQQSTGRHVADTLFWFQPTSLCFYF